MGKTLVILNPISGHNAAARQWPEVQAALRDGGLNFDVAETSAPRQAITLAENAKRDGYETVISAGGDGTVNEIVNGMMRASNENPCGILGILPIGSGNDFFRTFGLRSDWRAAVQRVLAGRTTWVDVGKLTGDSPAPGYHSQVRYFVNAIDTGFGAQAARHAHDFPFLNGMPMYLAAIFKTLVRYSVPSVRIDVNGTVIEQRSAIIAVANGRQFGGGFLIAPSASAQDGLLEVVIADGLGRLGILSLLPKVMKGTHIGDPRVKHMQAPQLVIDSPDPLVVEADGEEPFVDAQHLRVELLPKHLQLIV